MPDPSRSVCPRTGSRLTTGRVSGSLPDSRRRMRCVDAVHVVGPRPTRRTRAAERSVQGAGASGRWGRGLGVGKGWRRGRGVAYRHGTGGVHTTARALRSTAMRPAGQHIVHTACTWGIVRCHATTTKAARPAVCRTAAPTAVTVEGRGGQATHSPHRMHAWDGSPRLSRCACTLTAP